MSQKQADAQKSPNRTPQTVDYDALGPSVQVVRFAVSPDFRGKSHLGLSLASGSYVFGDRPVGKPPGEIVALPEGLKVVWFPKAGLLLFRRTRIDTAPGVDPVEVVEEKWLNDSTEQFLWWETQSQIKRVTPPSK